MDLVTGPFRPALESAFRELFERLRREDPLAPLAVVAPSQRLADHLKDLALEACPQGFVGVHFHNLFSFARTIYRDSVEGYELVLDDLVPEHLVRAILRRHFADTPYLSRAASSPRALLSALRQLKSGGVEPEAALQALLRGGLDTLEAPKLGELFSLHKRYGDELRRRKLHEHADVAYHAARNAGRSASLQAFRHVIYYGFTELDQNQISLLEAVDRAVPLTVFFPYREGRAYEFCRPFLDTFLRGRAKVRREVEGSAPPPRVRQYSASGAADEIWVAAKEILAFADRGIPYRRIGLVARTLEPYLDRIDAVFRENAIPWVSSARRSLAHDPAVKAARLLFSLKDFDRADVMDLLRSPFVRDREGDRELWDQASRQMGIGHGADEWRRRLGGAAGGDYVRQLGPRSGAKEFRLPKPELDRFWDAVRALIEAPPPPEKGWAAFSAWALERHARFLEPDERIEGQIRALARLEGFALEEPREALLGALAELSEPAGTPGLAGVRVYDAMAARGCSFDALVLVGMNAKVFPRYVLEDPFLRDEVRRRFDLDLGYRLPEKRRGRQEELLLFALLEGSADEIVLVHQRSDEKGRRQAPSTFLPLEDSTGVPRRPLEKLERMDFRRLTPVEASLLTRQGEALARAQGRETPLLTRALRFLREIESRGALTPYDGTVDTSAYWPKLASHGISPTALERLAECPFRYYAQGPLGLEELEEPEGESMLSALEVGQIYHDVLEQVHRSGDFERRLAEGLARFEATRSIRYPVLWEVEQERIGQVLRTLVEKDDCTVYRPTDFEKELKGELEIEAGGLKRATFRGFVDRLDRAADGSFRVVDYKRSGRKYRASMETGVFEHGKYLQPPLYFLLAQRHLDAPAAGSRFVYYFLEEAFEGGVWQRELAGDGWARRPEFMAHLRRYLDRIARGEFIIRPGRHCDFCDFRTICRRSHRPSAVRAEEADDPAPAKDVGEVSS
jgi:ATP-dependent helicase/nuclease subunit B